MHSHPTVGTLILKLKKEHHKSCQIYLQLESGDIKIRKKSELDKDAKIQQHIINWKLANALSILDKISIIVHIELNL
jgi:predicted PhzF superfamily epimerase YddE/YHI9